MAISVQIVRASLLAAVAACGLGLLAGAGEVGTAPAAAAATAPAADPAVATLITLHLKDAAPDEAFAALGKAAGLKFSIADTVWDAKGVAQSISYDADGKPFWEVLLGLCDKTGLTLPPPNVYVGNSPRISLVAANQFGNVRSSVSKRPHLTYGQFLVTADGVQRMRNVDLGGDVPVRDNTNVQMSVYWESRVRVGQAGQFVPEEVVDENGKSLLPEGAHNAMMMNPYRQDVQRGWHYAFGASLQLPENAGKKIARLKGSVALVVITRVDTLEVPEISTITEGVRKTIGDCTYVVDPIKPGTQRDTWDLQLVVEHNNTFSGRETSYAVVQSSQLLDAQGNAWRGYITSSSGSGNNQKMTYKLTFNNQPGGMPGDEKKAREPVKFVMEVPAQTKEVSIPIEFKDIPLP